MPFGELVAVGMVPVDPRRVGLRDRDHIVPGLAGLDHVHGVVAMTLRRDLEAVEVDVGGLGQVIDQAHVQDVPRPHAHHRTAVHAVIGRAVDRPLADPADCLSGLQRHVEPAILAAVDRRIGQRLRRCARRQAHRRRKERIELSRPSGSSPRHRQA